MRRTGSNVREAKKPRLTLKVSESGPRPFRERFSPQAAAPPTPRPGRRPQQTLVIDSSRRAILRLLRVSGK